MLIAWHDMAWQPHLQRYAVFSARLNGINLLVPFFSPARFCFTACSIDHLSSGARRAWTEYSTVDREGRRASDASRSRFSDIARLSSLYGYMKGLMLQLFVSSASMLSPSR